VVFPGPIFEKSIGILPLGSARTMVVASSPFD